MAVTRHLQHIKSNQTVTTTVDNNDVTVAKLPAYNDLLDGEIAINYHDGYETISIRNDNNEVVQFPNINAVNTLIEEAMSGAQDALTFDETPTANSTNPVTSEGIKEYVDAGDTIQSLTTYQSSTPLAVGDTHDQALSKLSKIIDDNEIVTARALTDLNDAKQDEISDLDTIRAGAALGATALQTETQLSKGTTTGNGNAVTDISVSNHQITLTKGATFLTDHQSIKTLKTDNTTAQSTSASEAIAGSGTINLHKVAKTGTYSDLIGTPTIGDGTLTVQQNGTSKGTFTANQTSNSTINIVETQLSKGATTGDGNAVTEISVSDHQITLTKGATFADGAEYDSDNHLIYLTYGNTRLPNPINAADFIKDGMVSSVRIDILDGSDDPESSDSDYIEERYLIITFNTDAGLEDIEIPITDIFDPSLYYTKEEIDEHELVTAAALTELHDTKADKTDLVNNNEEIYQIIEENELAISAALNDLNTNKQDKLNFDDEPTENSSNPVTSDGIKTYVDTLVEEMALVTSAGLNELNDTIEDIEVAIQNIQPELDFDDVPTANSTNPVTSGGIKTYVDNLTKITELNEPAVSTPLAVNDTYDVAFGKLTKIIRDNEYTTAGALTELYETKQDLLTFDDEPTEDSENPVTSGGVYSALSEINGELEDINDALEDIDVAHLFETTYSELKTLRDSGQLVPGAKYRITDYTCDVRVDPNTDTDNLPEWQWRIRSAGNQFDIILLALSNNTLAEEGWAMMHENETYLITFDDDVTKECYVYDLPDNQAPVRYIVDKETLLGIEYFTDSSYGSNIGTITIDDSEMTGTATGYASTDLAEHYCQYNYFQYDNLNAWKIWYSLDNDYNKFLWCQPGSEVVTYYKWSGYEKGYPNRTQIRYTTSPNPAVNDNVYDMWTDGDEIYFHWTGSINSRTVSDGEVTQIVCGDERLYNLYLSKTDDTEEIGEYLPSGTGVIYRMIDEWNNDIPYDFKNIQFIRPITNGRVDFDNGTNEWFYTFNQYGGDGSIRIGENDENDYPNATNNKMHSLYELGFNVFMKDANNNIFNGYALNNTFEVVTQNNQFSNGFQRNMFVKESYGYDAVFNNIFHERCEGNKLSEGCWGNEFAHGSSNNVLGISCNNNRFGPGSSEITLARTCAFNDFGAGISYITFDKGFTRNVIVESGNTNITLTSTQTTSGSNALTNIKISQGTNTTSTVKTISHNTVNDTYQTTYQAANSQVVSV